MERLTMTSEKGGVAFTFDLDINCRPSEAMKILKLAEKLKVYEDAEEQGLLLRLPVAIGQTVYTNHSMQGWYCRSSKRPYEAEVVYIGLNNCEESGGGYINISFKGKKGYMLSFTFREIGITWFLTKEEAEQALAEMKGE